LAIQQFTARVLDWLDRVYSIVGPISRVDRIDVSPPVLVADVSRAAEYSAGFWCQASQSITTGGAGVAAFVAQTREAFLAESDKALLLQERGLTAPDVDVWVYGWWGTCSVATAAFFSSLRIGLRIGGNTPGPRLILQHFGEADEIIATGATLELLRSTNLSQVWPAYGFFNLPILLPDYPTSEFLARATDNAGGAIVTGPVWRCWVGPKGVLPPR